MNEQKRYGKHTRSRGAVVPFHPKYRFRAGLGRIAACPTCGRTQDLWEGNNGEGLAKGGRRFCCKPCSVGDDCICTEIDQRKGQELGNPSRIATNPRRRSHKKIRF